MKNKYHKKLQFLWFDFWVGIFIDVPHKAVYICLIPMIVLKIWKTEHLACPHCGSAMNKTAVDVGEGWALFWECERCLADPNSKGDGVVDIEWDLDLKGLEWVSGKELQRRGYTVN